MNKDSTTILFDHEETNGQVAIVLTQLGNGVRLALDVEHGVSVEVQLPLEAAIELYKTLGAVTGASR